MSRRRLVRFGGVLAVLLILVVAPTSAALAARAADTAEAQGQSTYVVQWGDTLYKISRRFGVSIQAIRDANGIVGDRIYAGQRLIIPGTGSRQPSMNISPTTGQSGTRVRFTAAGFPANAPVNVWMGPSGTEATFKMPSRTLANGALSGELVPEGPPSSRVYIGITTPDGTKSATATFLVANQPGPAASLSITPLSGDSGTWVTASIRGFPYNSEVSIWGGPANSEGEEVARGATDANGRFSTTFIIHGAPGMRMVYTAIAAGGHVRAQSEPFTINGDEGGVVLTDVPFVMALRDVNIRSGPGAGYRIIGVVYGGQLAKVTGMSVDQSWWRVVCPDGATGSCWISARAGLTEPHSGF